uniref:peptidylprolyl isomerase n=1 Tax=Aceria tosichella TaxID=561515 RepID=A0A6G1SQ92_9ACAR
MDEEMNNIEIKTSKLALSANDIKQLTKPGQGCQLQMVSCNVHDLDTEPGTLDPDDSDADEIFEEDKDLADRYTREDRMRREFVSLVLNANRDPVKPGTRCRFKEFQEEVRDGEFDCDIGNLVDRYIGIHRMYENIGNFDEYMKANNFQEVSANRVYKLKRMSGVQLPVTPDSLVIYNCAFWTEGSKEPFDSTWLRRTTITTHLATDSTLPGISELLLSCCNGELCEALIRPEAAFGPLGAPPRIPPNATIFCLLEVVKVVTREKMAILTNIASKDRRGIDFQDYLEASDEARRRGNYFYEHGQYKIALQRYKSAIRLLEGLSCKDEDQEKRVEELLLKLYNNCARTANAMGNPRLALSACKQASEIDDKDPKTYWHRMVAWRKKGHLDRALGIARRAMQLFKDPVIVRPFQKAADELKIKIQRDNDEETELYRLMGRAWLTTVQS